MKLSLLALGLVALPSLTLAQDITAIFVDAEGIETGTATLTPSSDGVLISVEVDNLPPDQWVAFHVHEIGNCDPVTHHESAGGHFNPGDVAHGYLSDTGPHAGDMPNIWVDSAGVARAEVFKPDVTAAEGETSVHGRALMIHAGPDDYVTQPTGGAGDRLACAVVE